MSVLGLGGAGPSAVAGGLAAVLADPVAAIEAEFANREGYADRLYAAADARGRDPLFPGGDTAARDKWWFEYVFRGRAGYQEYATPWGATMHREGKDRRNEVRTEQRRCRWRCRHLCSLFFSFLLFL